MSEFSNVKKHAKEKYGIVLDGKQDWSFYINKEGEFQLHKQCENCIHVRECGQSYKLDYIDCKKYRSIDSKKDVKKGKKK